MTSNVRFGSCVEFLKQIGQRIDVERCWVDFGGQRFKESSMILVRISRDSNAIHSIPLSQAPDFDWEIVEPFRQLQSRNLITVRATRILLLFTPRKNIIIIRPLPFFRCSREHNFRYSASLDGAGSCPRARALLGWFEACERFGSV